MADLFEPDVELRWRGKETKVKTVSLPFQTVERIDLRGLPDLGGLHWHLPASEMSAGEQKIRQKHRISAFAEPVRH